MSAEEEENETAIEHEDEDAFESILEFLRRTRGVDFSGYKRTTIARRVEKRMAAVNAPSFARYLDYIQANADEVPQLFNMLLINVTSFFRDDTPWQTLNREIRRIVRERPAESPIRVWSAGCSTGEEPYSLAMLLAEELGLDAFSRRVKVYATDLDEDALAFARQATYPAKSVESVPAGLLAKYFQSRTGAYVLQKDLRTAVIFGRHDLSQDAPISRVDVLACRNTLMYFNAETQSRILRRLHFALAENGVVMLGKAEMLIMHSSLFAPVDLKLRIFKRASADGSIAHDSLGGDHPTREPIDETALVGVRAAFDSGPIAQVVLDARSALTLVNARATAMFAVSPRDIGRTFQDLELSYRPLELRAAVEVARLERRAVALRGVERTATNGEKMFLDIDVAPLFAEDGSHVGIHIAFTDVTQARQLEQDLRRAHSELDGAHQELQSTSEELETTNEELQSTVEELETTNEELQSTNEELETMNEELHSTNVELQTINSELHVRSDELKTLNTFFSSILGSLQTGVVVLDCDLAVKVWNHKMEDLWGLRSDEVASKNFMNLDVGFPIEQLAAPIRSTLGSAQPTETILSCVNRRGRSLHCRVTATALQGPEGGAILLFEESPVT